MLSVEQSLAVSALLAPYMLEERRARIDAVLEARTRDVTLVLEDVVSEHNGAAVLRSADAFGLMDIHFLPGPLGFRASRRVARGSQLWVDAFHHSAPADCFEALRARGYQVWASTVHGEAIPVWELPTDRPIALAFGNEKDGMSRAALDAADGRFHVPMQGFVESLNISVAAALSLASNLQARRQAGGLHALPADEREQIRARWYAQSVRAAGMLLERASLPMPESPGDYVDMVEDEDDA